MTEFEIIDDELVMVHEHKFLVLNKFDAQIVRHTVLSILRACKICNLHQEGSAHFDGRKLIFNDDFKDLNNGFDKFDFYKYNSEN
jgi:hypothetical protein